MALTTVLAQRAYLLGDLDDRVGAAAEHGLAGAAEHPRLTGDLSFLDGGGHPAGLLTARTDGDGAVLAARIVGQGTPPYDLTAAQRAALAGIAPDGGTHTRTVPGLGAYRLTALDDDGVRVLAGLPLDGVRDTMHDLLLIEATIAATGLLTAACGCALVIRRQLRPLRRLAATAAEVSRTPLARLPERDTDPGTEAGRVGAALNRMIDHAESAATARRHSEERMRRFLSDASHELRTPLASISGYAELMSRGAAVLPADLAWSRVTAESARMTGLVENLLLLARLDEGRPLERAETDPVAVVTEEFRKARAAAEEHDWRLELRLTEPLLILGDEVRLHQAVSHLLANAHLHTPPGTRVTVSVESIDGTCAIRVHDTGEGIPPALLSTVFDRFTRGDASRARERGSAGGSGLGLAVASAIVEAHGGTLTARSGPGGTEFTMSVPALLPV
ncbi:HAMP domain-containing sensor histidine kinase [Streptomyces sp. NPDC004539]|uniref:sensor histidine kinase n=1 Tax=Streptomyces sp. NPDC004539 TaxID=3154280 RepID=UPI0033B8231A